MEYPPIINRIEDFEYHDYHKKRLRFAYDLALAYFDYPMLEIGPWTITHWLRTNDNAEVDTLGRHGVLVPSRYASEKHYEYNLSNLDRRETWPITNKYNLIICCEVVEHLPVSMKTIMKFLYANLRDDGRCIIQTPNGAMLKRRIPLLLGRNPYDQIDETRDRDHAKHIREYTIAELQELARGAGFRVEETYCKNYFSYKHSWKARLYKFVCDLLPQTFHDGITLVLHKK